jgi:potassium-transporting ATPase KdpC subunit
MWRDIMVSVRALLVATLVTGLFYPLAMTGLAQALFNSAANGSPVTVNGELRGSLLIGQRFDSDRYFHGRPSAAGAGYDAASSGASNLAPSNRTWVHAVEDRAHEWRRKTGRTTAVPIELVTASGSGLDPHLSVAAARYQVPVVARARGIAPRVLEALIERNTEPRALLVIGEPRVNVLRLNLALDALT